MALNLPTARTRRWVPPMPGMMPMRISGWAKLACSPAMMMSQCIASSLPPPKAKPHTAAIIGFGQRSSGAHTRSVWRCMISIGLASTMLLMSPPAANTLAPPLRMMTRTEDRRTVR